MHAGPHASISDQSIAENVVVYRDIIKMYRDIIIIKLALFRFGKILPMLAAMDR